MSEFMMCVFVVSLRFPLPHRRLLHWTSLVDGNGGYDDYGEEFGPVNAIILSSMASLTGFTAGLEKSGTLDVVSGY